MHSLPTAETIAATVADDLPSFVPAKQAADYLNVSTRTLRKWIRCGKLAAMRTAPSGSGRVLIARDEIARFLTSCVEPCGFGA